MIVVTSGKRYMDIDAYASCLAYANLLNLKGISAMAVSTGKLNESITKSLLETGFKLDEYCPNENDEYVILDVSNKEYFDTFVKEEKIIEIIDHHPGFEEYWKENKNVKSIIEPIGSVATIIFELYEKENMIEKIEKNMALLLMAAILDNTLNMKAKITNKRDIIAYDKLQKIANIENYDEKYFKECQEQILSNLKMAVENDTKIEKINDVLPEIFAQLTVWNKDDILNFREIIEDTLEKIGNEWMLNLISLSDGKSYILSKNEKVQNNIEKVFNKKFVNDILELENVWLRKEIIKLTIN